MPFPFAALGVVGTILAGTAVTAGAVFTAAAISVYNDEKRAKARAEAEAAASRAREQEELRKHRELAEKKHKLMAQYGKDMPKHVAEDLWAEKAELLGALEGNAAGLKNKGQKESQAARDAREELEREFREAGVKE